MYKIEYHEDWDRFFCKLHPEIQNRIWKKIQQIKDGLPGRHLEHGLPFFVEEVGQHRICYVEDKPRNIRLICFAGDHKDYDKWRRK
jgi:mRNA-degrading endonuclease RelE of RelBE toxin-antitoxin system